MRCLVYFQYHRATAQGSYTCYVESAYAETTEFSMLCAMASASGLWWNKRYQTISMYQLDESYIWLSPGAIMSIEQGGKKEKKRNETAIQGVD